MRLNTTSLPPKTQQLRPESPTSPPLTIQQLFRAADKETVKKSAQFKSNSLYSMKSPLNTQQRQLYKLQLAQKDMLDLKKVVSIGLSFSRSKTEPHFHQLLKQSAEVSTVYICR
jgi:hypothetical protein